MLLFYSKKIKEIAVRAEVLESKVNDLTMRMVSCEDCGVFLLREKAHFVEKKVTTSRKKGALA